MNLSELSSNVVCYPQVKFLTTSNPVVSTHEGNYQPQTVQDMTRNAFKVQHNFMTLTKDEVGFWYGPTNIVYHHVTP